MKQSICSVQGTLRDALEAINNEPVGISFVVDHHEKLVGLLTDGDIRRLLLNGAALESTISSDMLGDFVSALEGEDMMALLQKTNKRIRIVPIVNTEGKLLDYFRYEHKTHFVPVAEPSLKGNELKYITDAVLSTWISSRGEYIDRFEAEFSAFSECEYGVAVSNGTVAIHLALVALGIGPGDEVIVPDFTFAATINTVLHTGATPVIVDVEKDSWCIDPKEIEKAITEQTKAIIPVHIYGQPCDMDSIMAIARKHDLKVIEDAAEAHGAIYKGRKVGSFGDAATFSFFGNKIITCGEGGMVVTNNVELDEKMRVLRDHGMSKEKRYWHDHVGYNYRLTNLQAAIGCAQLEKMENIQTWRSKLEGDYKQIFGDTLLQFQADFEERKRARWLISALLPSEEKRDSLIAHFRKNNIDLRPFFYPLSTMPVYSKYASGSFEISADLSERGVSLPTIEGVDLARFKAILDTWK